MGTPYSATITFIVTAGVLNIILGIYALSGRSRVITVKSFIVFCMLAAIYTFGAALELSSSTIQEIRFWIKFEYLGMPFLPPLNLIIILSYLGMERYLKRKLLIAMFAIPFVTLLLVLTNEWHHFYYRNIVLNIGAAGQRVDILIGPWYIIQGAYTFACMIGGAILLVRSLRKMPSYRFKLAIMLTGLVLPLIGDFLYLCGLTPNGMDPIPVIMTVTSTLYLWALTAKGLFHVVPIARDSLFTSMRDGVLILDLDNKLIDYNPAAAAMLPELHPSVVGEPLHSLWQHHSSQPIYTMEERTGMEAEDADIQEIRWRLGDQSYNYQIRSSVIRNQGGHEAGRLIVLIDVTEKTRLQEELRQLAYYDGLTRIYNRSHFMNLSYSLLSQAVRDHKPVSFLLYDIDHFKRINDDFGHDFGDQALLHVVELSRNTLRSEDVFARYGGEEFVIALPGLTLLEAEDAAERIRSALLSQPMITSLGPVRVTASFGVVSVGSSYYDVSGAHHWEWDIELKRILRSADRALYEAKRSGRNTIRFSEEVVSPDFLETNRET
ncbi:diguanylate cyclase [Bacillus sp. FJAT-18019]|nr:diguanylate cyclase [Bacillus sp. FJAT-18019]